MYSHIQGKQREILNYNEGKVVVKACPGSGKTYSVAARLSRLLKEKEFNKQGVAAISFTNIACDEIQDKLKNKFKTPVPLKYPHFLGTIDSFINKYIFLPFGHLVMGCKNRPELVGGHISDWSYHSGRKHVAFYQYFDRFSFNEKNDVIEIKSTLDTFFKGKWEHLKDHVNKSKTDLFEMGYANQSDAIYHAYRILKNYPLLAENIARRFSHFIIDEAQDTNEIQIKILEILQNKGLNNIMLIGDRDQAIFEWNDAKPELFDAKYNECDQIKLYENRRSSQKICDFTTHLSTFEKTEAICDEVKDFDFVPLIKSYNTEKNNIKVQVTLEESQESFDLIKKEYLQICKDNDIKINKENVAILYRGKTLSKYLGLSVSQVNFDNIPWLSNNYHVRDIVKGKLLLENGIYKKGYRLLEKGLIEAIRKKKQFNFYCNHDIIKDKIEKNGFKKHRKNVFNIIDQLPKTKNMSLRSWLKEVNKIFYAKRIVLKISDDYDDELIENLFGSEINSKTELPFYFGTVHSAKGKTFEAVLLILGSKPGKCSGYKKLLDPEKYSHVLKSKEEEELRIVYVAITRPRKILMLAVPEGDKEAWEKKFNISN